MILKTKKKQEKQTSIKSINNKENENSKVIKLKKINCNKIKEPKKKIISKSLDKVVKTTKQRIEIDLDKQEPTEIKSFFYYFKNIDINSKFYLKNNQYNTIYFNYGKKNKGCKGKIV